MFRSQRCRLLPVEVLELRRVLAAPDISGVAVLPAMPVAGESLIVTVDSATDTDGDLDHVAFYVDDGNGTYGTEDSLLGQDDTSSDGWQLSVPTGSPYRILPLGDSITQPSGDFLSYRYPLWQELIDEGYNFDFIGSEDANRNGYVPNYPSYQGQSFDRDHEGHSGWKVDQILDSMPGWLATYTPDVVLVHIGTNDMLANQSTESTLDELEGVVDALREDNPHVMVFVAQLIPIADPTFDANVDAFNAALPAAVADWTSPESPVILVDQNTGFDTNIHAYDGVHPNATGEQLMADRWMAAFEAARPLRDPAAAWGAGTHKVFAVAVDAAGNESQPTEVTVNLASNAPASPIHAETESARYGELTGNLIMVRDSDDVYEQIEEEVLDDGTPRLSHQWRFDIPAGSDATLYVEAHQSGGEDYYVNYSTDGSSYANVFAIGKTADDDQAKTWDIPSNIEGTLWIRIRDDNPASDATADTIFVDYLAVELNQGGPVLPEVSIAGNGDALEQGEVPGSFTVTRTGSTTSALDVQYAIAGSASNGSDYQSLSGTVTIPAGSNQADIVIDPIDDTADELTETVQLTLQASAAYDLGNTTQASIDIIDNDTTVVTPEVTIKALDDAAEASQVRGRFRISRTGATSGALVVSYTLGGTADASDYRSLPGTITIPDGKDDVVLRVIPINDNLVEEDETVRVALQDGVDYDLGNKDAATIRIMDNDLPGDDVPTVKIRALEDASEQGESRGRFRISRVGDTASELTVQYSVAGTATSGVDYVSLPGTFTIPAGADNAVLRVNPIDDTQGEATEDIVVSLIDTTSYDLSNKDTATILLLDNDGGASDFVATSEETDRGSVTAGDFSATNASDDVYEVLQESGGAGARLDHVWVFDVPTPTQLTLSLEAHTTGEPLWVNYSTDFGNNYANLLTVTKTSDDDTAQTRAIAPLISGTVWIQIRDSDTASSDVFADEAFVDDLRLLAS